MQVLKDISFLFEYPPLELSEFREIYLLPFWRAVYTEKFVQVFLQASQKDMSAYLYYFFPGYAVKFFQDLITFPPINVHIQVVTNIRH